MACNGHEGEKGDERRETHELIRDDSDGEVRVRSSSSR